MIDFRIDETNRCVLLSDEKKRIAEFVIKEFDNLNRIFLEETDDKYECELILLEVEIEESGENELKAFAKRKGYDNWIMEFNPEEYIYSEVINNE